MAEKFLMAAPHIILTSDFTLELRAPERREFEAFGQTAYLLLHARAADCFLINPNETLRVPKSDAEWLLLRLSPQLLIETATRLKLYRSGSNLLFSHPQTNDPKLQAILTTICNEMLESAAGWRDVIHSLVQQLTVLLLRSHMNLKRSEELELSRIGMVDRRLRRALEFMHDHCARELSLAEIAAAAYLSEFHFARLFKKITGTTPHAYLAALRIERARKLLVETDLAITEVGARVGYNSQSHFTKIFRQATGLTPAAFRTSGAEDKD
ncbi:MAG TPA: helix-turn-helix transcriptional regulator [Blastocatellia bacterium]|nr:helix-turn-helix transcriptional regulator [Blastocatellia bacterium]